MIIKFNFKKEVIDMPVLMILLILSLFNPSNTYAAPDGWPKVVKEIERVLEGAMREYEGGKVNQAMEKVADAYFGIFEGEKANMEIAVRRYISLKRATDLEKGFGDMRKAMSKRLPPPDVRKEMTRLTEALKEAARDLERKGVGLDVGYQ